MTLKMDLELETNMTRSQTPEEQELIQPRILIVDDDEGIVSACREFFSNEGYQLLTIELVGSAEVVDDFGNGFSGLGVALFVGQLEILDSGAVLIFAFGGS